MIAWNNYKNLKNLVNYKLRTTKTTIITLSSMNMRAILKYTWNGINSLTVSNAFNANFTSIGPKLVAEIDYQNENIDYDLISQRSSSHFKVTETSIYDSHSKIS
jgi:hypothetical protein